jgi:hypothetical protein
VTEGRTWLGQGDVSKVSPKSARLVALVLDGLAAQVKVSTRDRCGHHTTLQLAHDLVLALSLSLSQARQQRDAALRGYQDQDARLRQLEADLASAHRALAHNAATEAGPFGELAADVVAGVEAQLAQA